MALASPSWCVRCNLRNPCWYTRPARPDRPAPAQPARPAVLEKWVDFSAKSIMLYTYHILSYSTKIKEIEKKTSYKSILEQLEFLQKGFQSYNTHHYLAWVRRISNL